MSELNQNSVEFAFKQTLFGIVLMVRRAFLYAESPSQKYKWGNWKKATFADLADLGQYLGEKNERR